MLKIAVINGPNLNLLGSREPGIYGSETLEEICRKIEEYSKGLGIEVDFYQSNIEGEIVDAVQKAGQCDGLVINPAAYTHYSFAIRDAVAAINIPAVEVHISNIHAREEFRRNSVIAPVCAGQISGLGIRGYLLAIDYIKEVNDEPA